MKTFKNVALWVAGYVLITGLIFLVLPLARTPLMVAQGPKAYILTAMAAILCILGAIYARLAWKGRLEPKGVKQAEIRKEALDRISDETYLARVARDDPVPEVREKALKRLESVLDGQNGSS